METAPPRRPLPIGIRVFPTRLSEQIRQSPSLIHYSRPTGKVIRNVPREVENSRLVDARKRNSKRNPTQEQRKAETTISEQRIALDTALIYQHQKKANTEKEMERGNSEEEERNSLPPTHKIQDVIRQGQKVEEKGRQKSLLLESEAVLDDLDDVLDQQLSFDQIRSKIMSLNLTFRQYAPVAAIRQTVERTKEQEESKEAEGADVSERMRRLAEGSGEKLRAGGGGSNIAAPILNQTVLADLRNSTVAGGIRGVKEVNEERRRETLKRFAQTTENCEQVRNILTPAFCLNETPKFMKGSNDAIPEWKRLLLAKQLSQEAIRKEQQRLWAEFEAWKSLNDPAFVTRAKQT